LSILFDSLFNSVAYSHLIVDVINSQRAILLTYWSTELNWSETHLAFLTMLYIWAASLSQPIFGWISDKYGKSHWIAAGGILWISGFFTLALTLPTNLAVPCLILASLGSAAFHPVGAMQAALQGRTHYVNKETTATSWFFVFGQFGLMLGPIVGGLLLHWRGQIALSVLALIALPIGINVGWQLRKASIKLPGKSNPNSSQQNISIFTKWGFISLVLLASFQAWSQQNMITFIPKYLSDLGQSTAVYGLIVGLFMGGSALGNVVGGTLADRFGKQVVITTMLIVSSIPIFGISLIGWSAWLFVLVPLAGFFTGSVHSIIVVLAQHVIRSGPALATGLTLGFMFSAGALGTLFSGWLADQSGFPLMFQFTAGLVFVAACLPFLIKEISPKGPN
jgi:FSR family fosmidomycin resistance protein-like MFS transporter